MGSWAGRILLTARAGGWERLESDVAQDSFATGFRRCAWDGWWCGLGVELGCRRSAACVCERGDADADAAAGGKSGRWGACRGESGRGGCGNDSARAGRVVCGDAEDVYTGSIHFRRCPRLLFGFLCPHHILFGPLSGRQVEIFKILFLQRVQARVKGMLGRGRGGGREKRDQDLRCGSRVAYECDQCGKDQ